jgi:8-oxo-dGTP diphosphatase
MKEPIHVAAGALIDPQGRVLIARRHDDAHQGGLWEFPGGKCEQDETIESALARELHEELGVDVLAHRPLIRVAHEYADRRVLLDVHLVQQWHGEPQGREGQPLAWVLPRQLDDYPMPAADVPIVRALQLPDRYLITPAAVADSAGFLRGLEAALRQGIGLVQLRVFDLDRTSHLALAVEAQKLCAAYGALLLINADGELAAQVGAAGVHLSSRQLQRLQEPPRHAGLLAASCHTAEDLRHAQALGMDLAVLSPVLPTRSHPDAQPLGWERFAALADQAAIPVYALGGMHPGLLAQAWESGAQGVAGIRGLWPQEVP